MPGAYEKEGVYEGKTMIENGLQIQKVRKKGPTKIKMNDMEP